MLEAELATLAVCGWDRLRPDLLSQIGDLNILLGSKFRVWAYGNQLHLTNNSTMHYPIQLHLNGNWPIVGAAK